MLQLYFSNGPKTATIFYYVKSHALFDTVSISWCEALAF